MIWKELLIDLDFKYFRKAVEKICKENVDFYPGTNIPALIRREAKVFKSENFRKTNTFQERFDRYKLEAASPEEAKEFLEKVKFEVKGITAGEYEDLDNSQWQRDQDEMERQV